MPHRKPNYLNAEDRHRDRWIFSYTEVVTILLTLFVALAAQAVKRPAAAARSSQAAADAQEPCPQAPGRPATTDPAEARPSAALLQLREALQQRGITPRMEARGLVISLPQSVVFRSGQDQITPGAVAVIQQIARIVQSVPNKISLVGHADALPIHTARFKNNWELSAARSLQLLQVLTARYHIPESRLSVISYGSQSPRGSNQTEDGRAENRRVEIIIAEDRVQP